MFDRILFPTDGSEGATAAEDHVFDIAEGYDATLHILNVADTTHDSVTRIRGQVVDVLEREGGRIVEETAERARERNLSSVTEVVQGGVPETITDYAEEYDIDLIVLPTQGRTGIEQMLLGSVAERVLRQANVPVLTLHPDEAGTPRYPYRNVLVPTDGSACANAALETGIDIVKAHSGTLHLLTVVDDTSLGIDLHSELGTEALEDHANEVLEAATELAASASIESVKQKIEHSDSVRRAINTYIDENDIDLVVIGTHGRSGVDRYLLGSVAEKVVRTADVPVLTIREQTATE